MTTPRRIVSLLASATEILYSLGLGERVVACSHECDYPREVLVKPKVTFSHVHSEAASKTIDQEVRALVEAGMPLYEIDVEQIAALRPDLIITQSQCDVCSVRYEDVLAAVRSQPTLCGTPLPSGESPVALRDSGRRRAHRRSDRLPGPRGKGARQAARTRGARPRLAATAWRRPHPAPRGVHRMDRAADAGRQLDAGAGRAGGGAKLALAPGPPQSLWQDAGRRS